jgi:hypothetical protein
VWRVQHGFGVGAYLAVAGGGAHCPGKAMVGSAAAAAAAASQIDIDASASMRVG